MAACSLLLLSAPGLAVAQEKAAAPRSDAERDAAPGAAALRSTLTRPHRLVFVGSGALILGGIALSVAATGDAQLADVTGDAASARRILQGARQTAMTANLLYGVAGLGLVYALVLELLPEPPPDAATLTFRF